MHGPLRKGFRQQGERLKNRSNGSKSHAGKKLKNFLNGGPKKLTCLSRRNSGLLQKKLERRSLKVWFLKS